MKSLKSIKNRTEFYEFADIWYQRTHRLREIWQDEKETIERKEKAFKLWGIMGVRMSKIMSIAIRIDQFKHPEDFINIQINRINS